MIAHAMKRTTRQAVGYRRVSTEEQAKSGLGLEAQDAAIREAAVRRGIELAAVFTDAGESGSLDVDRRPGLQAALAAMKPGMVLVVAKHDRLCRDADLAGWLHHELRRRRCSIVAAEDAAEDGSSSALMERTLRQLFAAEERRKIAERTKAALAAKRARGEKTGGFVPFGFRADENGMLQPDPSEQWVVRTIAELRAAGLSLRRIAAELNARGIATKTGRKWAAQTVANVLRLAA